MKIKLNKIKNPFVKQTNLVKVAWPFNGLVMDK